MSSISGCTALITGGGTGIGLGTAELLADEGAIVSICGRTESKLVDAIAKIGHDARYIVADITDESAIASAVAFAAAPTGRLDICFANAGGSLHMGPVVDADTGIYSNSLP